MKSKANYPKEHACYPCNLSNSDRVRSKGCKQKEEPNDQAIDPFCHRALFVVIIGNTSGIGKHQTRAAIQGKKIQVPQRVDQPQALHPFDSLAQPEFCDCFSGARMYGKDYRHIGCNSVECLKNTLKRFLVIDI